MLQALISGWIGTCAGAAITFITLTCILTCILLCKGNILFNTQWSEHALTCMCAWLTSANTYCSNTYYQAHLTKSAVEVPGSKYCKYNRDMTKHDTFSLTVTVPSSALSTHTVFTRPADWPFLSFNLAPSFHAKTSPSALLNVKNHGLVVTCFELDERMLLILELSEQNCACGRALALL